MTAIQDQLAGLTAPGGRFEIVVEQVRGTPVRTFASRPRHLAEIAARGEEHRGDFLVGPTVRYSFAETLERSRRLAAALRRRHRIRPGDRVAVIGANAPDWVVSYWAGVMLDAVVVPLNAWWTAAELRFALEDAVPSVVLADGRCTALVADGDIPVVSWGTDGVTVDDLIAETGPWDSAMERGEDEVALLFYTSGTTGTPKGVMLTHRNVVAGFLNSVAMTTAARLADPESTPTGRQIDLCVVPLFHATANLAIMVPFLAAGHALVFMPPGRFDPDAAARAIETERVTRFGGVPTIAQRMVEAEVWKRHDLSSVQRVSYGGAPAPADLVQRLEEALPSVRHRVVQGYGLTETTAIATLNQGIDHLARPDSVGIPAPTVEVRIDATAEGVGEVLIRGSNVFAGYWRHDDRPFTTDGFFRTGDAGRVDEAGFLYLADRMKDIIVRGGENVSSVEVEEAISSHPAVREAAVVAAADPDLGEVVRAIVVLAEDLGEDALASHVRSRLAGYKVPDRWDLVRAPLPRNAAGKVLKSVLRGSDGPGRPAGSDSPL